MCFRLASENDTTKIAEEPIVVYKHGIRSLIAFWPTYRDFRYLKWKPTNKVQLRIRSCGISEGYHAYTELTRAAMWKKSKESLGVFIIPPKISHYRNNWDAEVVSESLIYFGSIYNPLTWIGVWTYKTYCKWTTRK